MKLKKFSVENYKVFKEKFSIDFSVDSIAILTGRNNTGKSTILEAINLFFKKESKPKTIPNDCYSEISQEIVFEAVFSIETEEFTIVKKYKAETAPKFYDAEAKEFKKGHEELELFEKIHSNKPFYITPSMLPDDINELIQEIYLEVMKNDLQNLEDAIHESEEDEELAKEYSRLKESYPTFLSKLKVKTDKLLEQISDDVSNNLQDLFSNGNLSINIKGGESEGFSVNDILKTTNSSVNIDSNKQTEMPLSNQGTGLQRMSLIYLIQSMIQNKFLGENANKLLLIDEPEAFLHPEAVRALSRSLYNIGEKMPLMVSTHSPILINLSERHTSIQVFRVGDKKPVELFSSKQVQFDDDDITNMKILNYIDSYVNEFFFAEKILIVEGDTEYIAFKHLADLQQENVHIIRARGKATIGTVMKILNQFNTNYDVLHDVDNHSRYKSSTLKAQLTNCKKILEHKKSDKIRIFSSVPNFERAIGLADVVDNKKTETIHKIIHESSEEGEYSEQRKKIEELFDQVINIDKEFEATGNFQLINSKSDYEKQFEELIEFKTLEEQQEGKNKERQESREH